MFQWVIVDEGRISSISIVYSSTRDELVVVRGGPYSLIRRAEVALPNTKIGSVYKSSQYYVLSSRVDFTLNEDNWKS